MKAAPSEQKLRGGYYTPAPIAQFLTDWAVRKASDSVLEPSCGDGGFLTATVERLRALGAPPEVVCASVRGVETDLSAATAARSALLRVLPGGAACVVHGDFFAEAGKCLLEARRFDAVIGNPPFIRYQDFPEEHRARAFRLMNLAGLHPNRLTNAWVPFVVASAGLLKDDGRLAMVLPAELFQVNYAAELRQHLAEVFHRITIVTFTRLVFADIQQEVVLLLGEKGTTGSAGIRIIECEDATALAVDAVTSSAAAEPRPVDHTRDKWTQYFLTPQEIRLLRALRDDVAIPRTGELMDIDVGIVTGQNDFFVVKGAAPAEFAPYVRPLVSRTPHLRGLRFTRSDWEENRAQAQPSYLLDLPDVPLAELPPAVQTHVRAAENRGMHQGYKCRIREYWYRVPSVWTPDAFFLRQVHHFPRVVLNEAEVTCTDTIHRVRFTPGVDGHALAGAFVNSMTFAFSEIVGRSYGGGVLTFEPSEAEAIPIPYLGFPTVDVDEIDSLLREGRVEEALDVNDATLLASDLGLSVEEIVTLRGIWRKLRDRRLKRRRTGSSRQPPAALPPRGQRAEATPRTD